MTLLQTRQLGIEFERRLQTLDPSFETGRKLDTETIYAYLNEAQKQVYSQLYAQAITTPSGVEQSKYISSVLGEFIERCDDLNTIANPATTDLYENHSKYYKLPGDYFAYIRSNSEITSMHTGTQQQKRVQNLFLRHEDFSRYVNEYFDEGIILRRPIAVIDNGKLHVICDNYTTLNGVALYYYRMPKNMDLFKGDAGACEMPYICFEQLVETAVNMYIAYVKGQLTAEKEQAKKEQQRKQKDDEQ